MKNLKLEQILGKFLKKQKHSNNMEQMYMYIHLEIPLIPNQRSHSGTCASFKSFMGFVIL